MSTCRWCTPVTPGAADLLQKYGCGSLTLEDEEAVSKDLCFCLECVVEYHRVRDELPSLHKRLWELETSRLLARFSQASEEELEEDDLLIVEDDQEIQVPKFTAAEYENFLRVPLTEILEYPYLMGHPKLCEMFVEALCKMEKTNSFQVFDKYQGIYLLLVHPNETVRRWAIRTARSLGKVDRDDFYDLQDIFTSMFCVIELDLFQNSDIDTSYDPASSKMVCLPSHLYDSSNYKNYWLGICMLLTVLDAQAMDSLLLGPDKKTDIMQCILNTMEKAVEDEGMDPFWPALQCFMVILDRLGSKIWGQLIEPAPAFQTITGSHSYTTEIDNIRQKTMMVKVKMEIRSDDDMVTCSQIIYDSNIKEKKKGNSVRGSQGVESGSVIYEEMQSLMDVLQSDMGQDMRVHNSTFLWFIPFVQSVMDLNDLSIVYIGEIIHYLCGEIKDLINGRVQTCDKVTEFFILILVFIVELHLNKDRMKVLYYSSPKWVEVIVKCATLPCAVFHNSVDSGSHRVSSTSSLKPLSRSPQVSTVVPQACMLLIRSLLKEGGKLTLHIKSMQFLDLLNKQIREMPLKEWSLTGSDVKELQNCLKCLVKLMRDKTPAAATGIVENVDALMPPPSNNPAEPYVQHCNYALKYEQRWDGEQGGLKAADGRDNAGFRTGETDVISVKKEPYDSDEEFESVGELKAPLQVTKMVPDPGKLEELKSRLSPALFSKLQVIAQKQSDHKNLTDNISSDVEQSNLDRISREPLNTFVGVQEPDSSRPSTSDAAVAHSSVFAQEGSEYGDDVPLSTKNFLKKTQKSKHCETDSSFQADTDNDQPSVATNVKEPKYCVHSSPESSHVKERREQKGRKKERNAGTNYNQDLKDRADPAMDVIIISDSDSAKEDNDISVSSKKEIENQCRNQKLKVKSEHLNDIDHDHELQESPSHCDLSEYDSQLFEFETQDYIFSAWDDHAIDGANPEAERGLSTVSEQLVSPGPSDLSHNLGYDTEPISDELIENAVLQAEQQAQQQKRSLEHQKSSSEKRDVFLEPKPLHIKNSAKGSPYRKKQVKSSITSVVSRIEQPNKKTDSKSTLSRFASELPTSSLSTPAIVPPKKVRKPVEPTSAVEKLGLKKKERKAFDLSQRSLHCVGQLRKYGQGVQVEQKKQIRRTRKSKMISPQKLTVKGNKKLLASQDLQFFRQSRAKPRSFRRTNLSDQTAGKGASDITSKTNSKWNDILKPHTVPEDEEDHSVFPPLWRPDTIADHSRGERSTDRRSQEKLSTTEISSSDSHLGFSTTMCKDPLYSGGHRLQAKEVIDDVKTDAAVDKDDVGKGSEDNVEEMCRTQIEPVDMELCSQVEDDDDLFLTQRDPVDMDIDAETETYEGKSPWMDQAKERPDAMVSPQPESPAQKPSTSHKGDDHLFLKPGMSPLSLKKAKPSTTKIYAPSSRSATLVQEMEKTTKPLPSAAVAKSKFARPEVPVRRTSTPQPEFHQPLLKHPVSSHSIQSSAVGLSPQVPSYKIYARPETPINREVPRMDASHKFDQSVLIQTVLKWTYDMFCSYTQFGVPSDLCSIPLKEVASTYRSYDEYFETFYPLLLINTFEELVNDWIKKTASGQLITHHLKVVGIEYSNKIANASFTACLSSQVAEQQLCPKEDDLVILWLPQNIYSYSCNEPEPMEQHACFGYVSQSNLFSDGTNQTLNITIQTRGNVSSVNNQVVKCQLVGSLVSAIRELRALYLLKTNIMFRPLLAPQLTYFQPGHEKISVMSLPEFNPEQVKAISWGLSIVKRQQRTPKICLIHGPPGTGKSKTIAGLLHCLFSGGHENLSGMGKGLPKAGRLRVLLCAPSNAAIDSLMKKIIVVFKENCRDIQNPQGNCGDINLVRLGMEKTISKHLKPFSLDSQTRVRTQKAQQGHDMGILQRKVQLDQRIDQLSQRCATEKKGTEEFRRLIDQKLRLSNERKQLGRQLKETRSRKQETQAKLLQGAHIICCTLSTSGSMVLESAFRRLGHEPFSCIIVDEAGQATEPETLIPMLYRCPALILVGDPEQLPPTVISQTAKEKKYDQSLMARLWKCLHRMARENPQVCVPYIFLRVQYRMHPEICQFPSMHVYGRTLETDRNTVDNRRSNRWPFQPYILFDVTDGRETKERESFCNHKEVKLVLFLIKMMLDKQIIKVGVITPYNAQKLRIQESINREMAKEESKRLQVEVDTVDGFQGREMDCIIVSCVRASGEPGSIGFLGNRQRLNVTITRAKYSLFILGHLRTLREQSDWGALIQDAYVRGTIVKTREKDFRTDAMQIFKQDSGLIRSLSYPPKEPGFPSQVGLTAEAPAFVNTEKIATGSTSATSAKEKATPTTAHQVSDVHQVGGTMRGRGLLQRSERPRDPRLAAQPPHPRLDSREQREQGHSSSFPLNRALRGSREEHAVPHHVPGDWRHWDSHPKEQSRQTPPHVPHHFRAPHPQPPLKRPPDSHRTSDTSSKREKR
ncbi:probable helicase senataxin isoform X2 [Megalops cyprinoides]|nr:probable helicase senataxin isoform X2 [Megalops cyprinoides]